MRILLTLPLVFALAVTLGLGVTRTTWAADPAKKMARITYDEHILPLLKDKCVSCHSQDKKRGGLILNNYTRVMEGGSSGACVKAGDAEGSLLYKVMAHTSEPFMPPSSPKLPNDSIELMRKWIAGGAPENAGSKVVVVDKPKVDFTLAGASRGKPAGPPPMPPATLSVNPLVRAPRDTAVTALAASPWAPLLAVGGQKQVLLYNTDTLALVGVLPFPEGTINTLKFSRNGALLLAGGGRQGKSGRVVIWSVVKGERLFAVGDESDAVLAADISPDQTLVAMGSCGKVVRVYSTREGKMLHEIRKHTDWITAMEFSPDGVLLATGDRNGGLFVWEAYNGREYFTLKGHTAAITEISWRPDSNVVGSSSEDSTVRLFEMENGNQIRLWNAHGGGSESVRYGHDGRIVSAGRDRVTKLWDGNGGAQRNFEALSDVGLRAVFTHDQGRVITSDWSGQILVFQTADGKKVGTVSANPASLPEQLAEAQKTLAEKQKLFDALDATAKASEAAQAKLNTDVAMAQKQVTDTTVAFKAAEAKLNQVRATVTTAQAAFKNAEQEMKAKDALAGALAEASGKVKAEAEKDKANPALQNASTRALSLAGQAAAEQLLAQKSHGDMQTALRAVEPALNPAQQAFNATQAAMQAAPKTLAALQANVPNVQKKAAADRAAANQLLAELNAAKATVARLQAQATPPKAAK